MRRLLVLLFILSGILFAQYDDYNPVLEDTTEIFTPWFLTLIDTTVSPPETTFVKAPLIKIRYIEADSGSIDSLVSLYAEIDTVVGYLKGEADSSIISDSAHWADLLDGYNEDYFLDTNDNIRDSIWTYAEATDSLATNYLKTDTIAPDGGTEIIIIDNVTIDSNLSVPDTGTGSERFGAGAQAGSDYSTVVGNGAYTGTGHSATIIGYGAYSGTGNLSTVIGRSAYSGAGYGAVVIGYGAHTGGSNGSTAIGAYSIATGVGSYALGYGVSSTGNSSFVMGEGATTGNRNYSIALGSNADASGGNAGIAIGTNAVAGGVGGMSFGVNSSSAANTFVAGGTQPIYNVYFGEGITNATPVDYTIHGTGGSGTDIAGGDITIAGGKGTGNAAGGEIIFQTSDAGASGTTLQSLSTKMVIDVLGNVGIGAASPSAELEVVGGALLDSLAIGSDWIDSIYYTGTTPDSMIIRGKNGTEYGIEER